MQLINGEEVRLKRSQSFFCISYRKEGKGMEIVRSVSKEKPEINVEIKLPATVDGVKVRRAVREARIAIRRLTDRKIKIRYKYSAKVF